MWSFGWEQSGGMAEVERECEVDEEDGEEPAGVVGEWDAEPDSAIAPAPGVEERAPNGSWAKSHAVMTTAARRGTVKS